MMTISPFHSRLVFVHTGCLPLIYSAVKGKFPVFRKLFLILPSIQIQIQSYFQILQFYQCLKTDKLNPLHSILSNHSLSCLNTVFQLGYTCKQTGSLSLIPLLFPIPNFHHGKNSSFDSFPDICPFSLKKKFFSVDSTSYL